MRKKFVALIDGRLSVANQGDNFSYYIVDSEDVVEIALGQQMQILDVELKVDGELVVEGELISEQQVVIPAPTPAPAPPPDNFSFYLIQDSVVVPAGEQMTLIGRSVQVENGQLTIEGDVTLDDIEVYIPPPPVVFPDNFSYRSVSIGEEKVVPIRQQMLLDGGLEVEGELAIEGEVFDLSEPVLDFVDVGLYLPLFEIATGELVTIPSRREYWLNESLGIDGGIFVEGKLLIGA